jgi:hypothetical protein
MRRDATLGRTVDLFGRLGLALMRARGVVSLGKLSLGLSPSGFYRCGV